MNQHISPFHYDSTAFSRMMRSLILWVVTGLSSINALAAQVTNITQTQSADKASFYCTVNGSFTHKLFTLSNPSRVVLDLKATHLGVNMQQLHLTNALVKQVRAGVSSGQTLRLVFEVNQAVRVSSAPWQAHGSLQGVRIDLVGSAPVGRLAATKPPVTPAVHVQKNAINHHVPLVTNTRPAVAKAKPQYYQKSTPAQAVAQEPQIMHQIPIKVSHSPSRSLRDVIVVLDAGHGGKDPGAKGPHHSEEKHVVLAITLKLKKLIDKQPGMRAVLTRSGDYYVGLRQRLHIARRYNGDIFVAIHADAFNNPHSNGASVFALSQRGATSEAARWIAEKENYSELGGVNLGDLDDSNGVVRSVLIDLSQTATINSSVQMGDRVLGQLNHFTRLHNSKVEQARFMVLKSPDIPSILVETGFISNPIEERNLTNPAYQDRLSQAIFQGIKGYFWSNPPHGTRIEAMVGNSTHMVQRGETLPAIAAHYHVSPAALQASNHLSAHPLLSPGQKLVVPAAWA